MNLYRFFTVFLVVSFLSVSVHAADITNSPPTIFVPKGTASQWDGYLIDFDRLEKCIICTQEVKSNKERYNLENKYLNESLRSKEIEFESILKAERSERKWIEEGLKQKLAEKEVWYKKPSWVAAGTAAFFLMLMIFGSSGRK